MSELDPKILTPEYWDGHSFNDECRDDRKKKKSTSLRGLLAALSFKVEDYSADTLNTFLKIADKTIIRSYHSGDYFKGDDFPFGTVIRYKHEILHERPISDNTYYLEGELWGVLAPLAPGDKNLGIYHARSNEYWEKYGYDASKMFGPMAANFEVGNVKHTIPTPESRSHQALSRIYEVRLMQMGKGLPASMRERAEEGLRKLIPIFNRPQA